MNKKYNLRWIGFGLAFSTYIIIVVTGEHFSAGTDAIVSLRIYGEHGNSS